MFIIGDARIKYFDEMEDPERWHAGICIVVVYQQTQKIWKVPVYFQHNSHLKPVQLQ